MVIWSATALQRSLVWLYVLRLWRVRRHRPLTCHGAFEVIGQ